MNHEISEPISELETLKMQRRAACEMADRHLMQDDDRKADDAFDFIKQLDKKIKSLENKLPKNSSAY